MTSTDLAIIYFCLATVASAAIHLDNAFTREECVEIVSLFDVVDAENDERKVPLLPHMNDSFVLSRRLKMLHHAPAGSEAFDWVYERIIRHHPALSGFGDVAAFRERVLFVLLHEFDGSSATKFDWHCDTKPGDGKRQRVNVNVMLSRPEVDFGGGRLQVGEEEVASSQGDLLVYASAMPHRVLPVSFGRRHTLVVALTSGGGEAGEDGPAAYETDAGGEVAMVRSAADDGAYWERVGAAFDALASGALAAEPKVHILHGEFLEGLGRAAEAQLAYCHAYRASAAGAAEQVKAFVANGTAALQGDSVDLALAEGYFAMAVCIDGAHEEAQGYLHVVRDAMRIRAEGSA